MEENFYKNKDKPQVGLFILPLSAVLDEYLCISFVVGASNFDVCLQTESSTVQTPAPYVSSS